MKTFTEYEDFKKYLMDEEGIFIDLLDCSAQETKEITSALKISKELDSVRSGWLFYCAFRYINENVSSFDKMIKEYNFQNNLGRKTFGPGVIRWLYSAKITDLNLSSLYFVTMFTLSVYNHTCLNIRNNDFKRELHLILNTFPEIELFAFDAAQFHKWPVNPKIQINDIHDFLSLANYLMFNIIKKYFDIYDKMRYLPTPFNDDFLYGQKNIGWIIKIYNQEILPLICEISSK